MTLVQTEPKAIKIGSTDIKKVMLGSTQIRPVGWQPGANTLAYFPFENDTSDHSGNGVVLANTQYFTQDTIGYKWTHSQGAVAYYTAASFSNANVKFISLWYKISSSSGVSLIAGLDKYGSEYYTSHNDTTLSNKITVFTDANYNKVTSNGLSFNAWHNISIGYDDTSVKISKDGVQETLYTGTPYNMGNTIYVCGIGNQGNLSATVSNVICESQARTATEVARYYNQTKGNYGL